MKRSVALALLVGVGLFLGSVAIHPAMAVDDAPEQAPAKCPMCGKKGSQMSPEQWNAKCAAMKKKFYAQHKNMWRAIREAVCVLQPTAGNSAKGIVRFIKNDDRTITVVADLEGLSPNSTHAIHIHQYGDCSLPNGKSAGGHYNPQGHPHALPDTDQRHAGDLGNLVADAQGNAHYEIVVSNICIVGHWNPILGRGVIVHAKADDGGQPTGNAGSRIACGVIGIANSPANKVPATAPTTAPATQPSQ